MKKEAQAQPPQVIEWSNEDRCFIGSAPPLVGQCCHGDTEEEVARQLSDIISDLMADQAADKAWAAEIKRRVDDMESGREPGVPGEQVMARVRKIVGL